MKCKRQLILMLYIHTPFLLNKTKCNKFAYIWWNILINIIIIIIATTHVCVKKSTVVLMRDMFTEY